jgi:uncharacterized protein YkwD
MFAVNISFLQIIFANTQSCNFWLIGPDKEQTMKGIHKTWAVLPILLLLLTSLPAQPVQAMGTIQLVSSTETYGDFEWNDVVAVIPVDISCSYQTNTAFEAQVIELINAERAKVGLPPLYTQSQLMAAARLHSADMGCNDFFGHTGSDGSSLADRLMRQGYSGYYFGENIAAGYSTPESVVNAWMNSSGHRANILNANYTDVGVGYVYWSGSTYKSYWTADFATPYTYSISGRIGTHGGINLSYLDGTTKTVKTDVNGNYIIRVSSNWSGTITPLHDCYTFSPTSRSYNNVTTDQTAQDYTASFDNASGCANTNVFIGSTLKGNYAIPSGGQVSPRYPAAFAGPVQVVSTTGQDILVSERQIYGGSFTETLGIPDAQLTTDYWFPWYDGMTMSTWISIGAPDTNSADAQVDIYIGGVKVNTSPYVVSAGGQVSPSFPGTFDGPVEVVSTNGQDILVSERQIYGSSFTETLGVPDSQLTTDYWFPWYDGMTMSTWISIGVP